MEDKAEIISNFLFSSRHDFENNISTKKLSDEKLRNTTKYYIINVNTE